jgi:hypothetical protein
MSALIHLNPLRAGVAPHLRALNAYRYGGQSALMGTRHDAWQETGSVLSSFGTQVSNARKSYDE